MEVTLLLQRSRATTAGTYGDCHFMVQGQKVFSFKTKERPHSRATGPAMCPQKINCLHAGLFLLRWKPSGIYPYVPHIATARMSGYRRLHFTPEVDSIRPGCIGVGREMRNGRLQDPCGVIEILQSLYREYMEACDAHPYLQIQDCFSCVEQEQYPLFCFDKPGNQLPGKEIRPQSRIRANVNR